jgi:hypothetical protein
VVFTGCEEHGHDRPVAVDASVGSAMDGGSTERDAQTDASTAAVRSDAGRLPDAAPAGDASPGGPGPDGETPPDGADDDAGISECMIPWDASEGDDCASASVGAACRFGANRPDLSNGMCNCTAVGSRSVWVCTVHECPIAIESVWCETPTPLTVGTPLLNQNTVHGGRGECAPSASGTGARNLYYSVEIPRGERVRVVPTPVPGQNAVMRVLRDCRAPKVERSARGPVCLNNDTAADRTVVIAIGRYSGEAGGLDVEFDISVELVPADEGCL